jgi:hypothetical protein
MTDFPAYPENIETLEQLFHSEQECINYIIRILKKQGLVCEKCGNSEFWCYDKVLQCTLCRHKTRLLAGTIFQDTKLPLTKWFRAMWEIVSKKNGCSALALQGILGVTYKTVWTMFHKLRRAMVIPGRNLLNGDVEVDETYFGGLKEGHPGRGSITKALIILGVEIKGGGNLGELG